MTIETRVSGNAAREYFSKNETLVVARQIDWIIIV